MGVLREVQCAPMRGSVVDCSPISSTESSATPTPRDSTLKQRLPRPRDNSASSCREAINYEDTSLNPVIWRTAVPWIVFQSKWRTLSLFLVLDFLIYLDRGIVPGAHSEFSRFLMQSPSIRRNPELYFGLLQSVFIAGLAISAPILSYLAGRERRPMKFLSFGLSIWVISIAGCGFAGLANSVWCLFFFRSLSGVGEGAFIGLVAPILMDACNPKEKGTFLGLFYGVMPFGVALGFISSAAWVTISHWSLAFLLLAALSSIPIGTIILFSTRPAAFGTSPLKHFALEPANQPVETPQHQASVSLSIIEHVRISASAPPEGNQELSIPRLSNSAPIIFDSGLSTTQLVRRSYLLASLLACGAAQAAVSSALSSFGTAYLLDLGVLQTQISASTIVGVVAAATGTVGTLIGGLVLRFPLEKQKTYMRLLAKEIPLKSDWKEEDARQYMDRISIISYVSNLMAMLAGLAAVLAGLAPVSLYLGISHYGPYGMLGTALLALAMTQPGINLSVMMTVPEEYRSMAISFYTLGLHIFGDVPGPIAVGYLKDKLAPHCRPDAQADEQMRKLCRKERAPLIMTLILALNWTHWVWIGLLVTYLRSRFLLKVLSK